METTRPILYGVSDYAEFRKANAWFVDRTAKIRDLEATRFAMFLRPRCFGKSLLVSILQAYYDDGDVLYPLSCITGLDLRQHGLAVDDEESPGLAVNGRGCQPHTLLDVVQLLLWYRVVLVLSAALSRQA